MGTFSNWGKKPNINVLFLCEMKIIEVNNFIEYIIQH
jgi:hypothetical protein